MQVIHYTTHSLDETTALGEKLAASLKSGDIVLLKGELGAGKTTLVKGIARGLGIDPDTITSPTFTIMNLHSIHGRGDIKTLCHIDTYRLASPDEFIMIGTSDYVGKPGVVSVIEWPEKFEHLFPAESENAGDSITIGITHSQNAQNNGTRSFVITKNS